jgi:archaellum biogenesis ATPase FlaH
MTNLANSLTEGSACNSTSPIPAHTVGDSAMIVVPPQKKYVRNFGELVEKHKNSPAYEFLWRGIRASSFGFIFGPPKSGKSSLCECLALHIAAGRTTFLGTPLQTPSPTVLYIGLEEDERSRLSRNNLQSQSLSQAELEKVNINFRTLADDFPRMIISDDDWNLLRQEIIRSKASTVMIDSFTRLCAGSVEQSLDAHKILMKLRKLCHELKVTLICIHHTPKNNGKGLTMDSMAGSRVLAQEADFIIGVNKIDQTRYIKDVEYRYVEPDEQVMIFNITETREIAIIKLEDENHILKEAVNPKDKKSKTKEVLLRYLQTNGGTTGPELYNEFVVVQGLMKRSTLYYNLDKLIEDNVIEKDPSSGHYSVRQGGPSPTFPSSSPRLDLDSVSSNLSAQGEPPLISRTPPQPA